MKKSILKYKLRAIVALMVLIMVVFLHSMAGRQRVSELQHSVSSIYNDRLMPATYIFEITDHMYQKKLLMEHNVPSQQGYAFHNERIERLVKNYESTYLTPQERQHWQRFKVNLVAYNKLEQANMGSLSAKQEQHFHSALKDLHQLASIQAGEGKKLNSTSLSILQGNDTIAQIELYIMLVLGLCVVVLVTLPEKVTVQDGTSFSLN